MAVPADRPLATRAENAGEWRAAWWIDATDEPGGGLRACLAAAVSAPSVHNTQPWLFHATRAGVDVYADPDRRLPVIDPTGRERVISVGAAVFNLRLAILARGRIPVWTMLPAPDRPDLLVRVALGEPRPVSTTVRTLAWAIPRRRSNRWPFVATAVPAHVLAELAGAARAEGATLRVPGPAGRRIITRAAAAAERRWAGEEAYLAELAAWTQDATGRRDGVPAVAFGPRNATGAGLLRDLGRARPPAGRHCAGFEPDPTLVVVHTADTPAGWLRAGQALERILLTATVHGLAATLITQPLEIPRLRGLIGDPRNGYPAQAVVRLGYASRPGLSSPRRPVAEVLRVPPRPGRTP